MLIINNCTLDIGLQQIWDEFYKVQEVEHGVFYCTSSSTIDWLSHYSGSYLILTDSDDRTTAPGPSVTLGFIF